MVEAIQKIRAAEENAEELRKSCRQSTAQMRDEATANGKRHLEERTRRATSESAAILKSAEDDAAAYLAQAREKSQALCDETVAAARQNLPRAADFIVERIVGAL